MAAMPHNPAVEPTSQQAAQAAYFYVMSALVD
jgi:hypothetical protein